MFKIYEVAQGETIDSIANKLNITKETILGLNGLNPNTILNPGSYIVIPGEESVFENYTVKEGDNVYSIAQKYNINYEQLLKLNGLNERDYIYPNQQILVPKSGTIFYVTKDEDTIKNLSI